MSGLSKTLGQIVDADAKAIVIVNPHHGDLSNAGDSVTDFLKDEFSSCENISPGILLDEVITLKDALKWHEQHSSRNPVFIHAGFSRAGALVEALGKPTPEQRHVFMERSCGKLYQRHFKGATRILLRDGFKRQVRNKDYKLVEPFSDLHVTFEEEGMDGFGDFLIVGDEYNEAGGPAYTVAIHLTFIDPDQDDLMKIYHFKSTRQDTPTDPAGKFAEALEAMINRLDRADSKVFETDAVKEFRTLHSRSHFPGLGYVKKLSLCHHIETLDKYFAKAA